MPAEPSLVRFYADESALGLGKVLCAARKDVIHCGHALIPECPIGSSDVTWIPAVAARDLVVISRDKAIRTRKAELEALRSSGLRTLMLTGKRDRSTWEYLGILVRRWNQIENLLDARGPGSGPWIYALGEDSLDEITA